MGKQGGDHRPTNRHTRVDNFMLATGTDPKTRARVPKNHKLAVRASAEFINRVMSNGEIIIRDHFKPLCDRVFTPADLGGIAGVSSQHEQPLNSTAHTLYDALLFNFSSHHAPTALFSTHICSLILLQFHTSSFSQGTKYIVDEILYKVACPADDSPYLGSYELAQKATGHDLRGAISIFHAIEDENMDEAEDDINLNCNMMAIIDHLGERQTSHTYQMVVY